MSFAGIPDPDPWEGKLLKIGIWDGCANGGMMDSLSIAIHEPGNGQPYAVCEISEDKWKEWQAFLKLHNEWESFWDARLCAKENRYHGDDDEDDE